MISISSHNKILFILLLSTFILYFPGLYGDFILDDKSNIIDESAIRISSITYETLTEAAKSGVAGPLKRPVSVISFALNYYYSGLNPFYFKLVNVILHLLTGICVYILSSFLASQLINIDLKKKRNISTQIIALICTALWLLHPLNISSVCCGLIELDTLIRDNNYQLLRCQNGTETN
ncbi:MAG: hypothetical protein KZQ70_12230, partial [gamma proteobacterium symbiont of Lucinoma myriamae]|nr:hypothetical protein [gamma proteobacterium symbiont of Lucinoma myriamae]MCU7819795.1 hypothetical protein [gamma proteobacterium symbiont of Lucinoma myriamae]